MVEESDYGALLPPAMAKRRFFDVPISFLEAIGKLIGIKCSTTAEEEKG